VRGEGGSTRADWKPTELLPTQERLSELTTAHTALHPTHSDFVEGTLAGAWISILATAIISLLLLLVSRRAARSCAVLQVVLPGPQQQPPRSTQAPCPGAAGLAGATHSS
jgi:hypothetical protein